MSEQTSPVCAWPRLQPKLRSHFLVTLRVADTLPLSYVAVITTGVRRVTRLVVTLKLTDVAPAGTMTVAGTVATFGLLLTRVITAPPKGAGALNITVPVEVEPPLTLVGLRVNELSAGNCTSVDVGNGAGVDVGIGVDVDVGNEGGVAVGIGVEVDFDIAVEIAVGVGAEAPNHRVAITFELL